MAISKKKKIQLFEKNKFLVLNIVNKMRQYKIIKRDDLLQIAYLAMWKAIQNFDPKKGKLSTHATHRVAGDLKNAIRDEYRRNGNGEIFTENFCQEKVNKIYKYFQDNNQIDNEQYLNSLFKSLENYEATLIKSYYGICGVNKLGLEEIINHEYLGGYSVTWYKLKIKLIIEKIKKNITEDWSDMLL